MTSVANILLRLRFLCFSLDLSLISEPFRSKKIEMVFENIVVYLLDKFLGDYIENLDTKKLKIDLWSGSCSFIEKNETLSVDFLQEMSFWKNST